MTGLPRGLIIVAVPFVLLPIYLWFVFRYAADSIVTPRLDSEHREVHLAVFYTLTFFPFSLLFFFPGSFFLARAWTQHTLARWVVPPLLAFALLALLWYASNLVRGIYAL
jgi:hypothetical protein